MENRNNGKILCIISLVCMFAMPVVIFAVAGLFMSGDISGATAAAYSAMVPFQGAAYVAAWVLAIVARVKYKNTFSLVLLIIYGSLAALAVFGVVALVLIMLGI